MKNGRTGAIGLASLLILQACAMAPMGPTVQVLPPPGKPFEQFVQERSYCSSYASSTVQGQADALNQRAVGGAVLGTVLGAGLGAAIGRGRGAAVGAASGAALGTGIGASGTSQAQNGIQGQYDDAYVACMVSKGNQPPVAPAIIVQQPGYLVQPAPYVVQPAPYVVRPSYPY